MVQRTIRFAIKQVHANLELLVPKLFFDFAAWTQSGQQAGTDVAMLMSWSAENAGGTPHIPDEVNCATVRPATHR